MGDKIQTDPKIGDVSHKDPTIVQRSLVVAVALTLILGFIILLSGGISQAQEENLIADEPFQVTEPEFMGVSEPEFMGVTPPEFIGVSEPGNLGISEPKSLESGLFPEGEYAPAKRANPAYDRCAQLKGFSARQNCALEALGTAPE